MPRRGPLASSYAGALGLVAFSLIPYLMLSAAVFPLLPLISKALHLSSHSLDVTVAMSTAAYSFGTVLAVQLAARLPPRRMLLAYEALFVAASVAAAWSPSGWVFVAGFVVQGLCTSLLLIASVPPLVTGFGHEKLPMTGGVMNLCIFGAVAVGPTLGAIEASGLDWRMLFWVVCGLAGVAALLALVTYEHQEPIHPDSPVDFVGVGLAGAGCGLAFFGAGEIEASHAVSLETLVPLVAGVAMLVAMIAYEYRAEQPLMPVKQLASTFPVFGIFTAATASASSFALMELVMTGLHNSSTPTTSGLLFLPEFLGAVAMAALFGRLFRSRWTPVMTIAGLVVLAGGGGVLLVTGPSGSALVGVATGLIGLGVGASVSPALYVVGFTLRSSEIQRVFALVELIRGVTAFLVAPILAFVAAVVSVSAVAGFSVTVWICVGIATAGVFGGLVLLWAGRAQLQVPDLARWQEGEPAWKSPSVLARLRSGGPADAAASGGTQGRGDPSRSAA